LFDVNAELQMAAASHQPDIDAMPLEHLLSDLRRRLTDDVEGCAIVERIAADITAIESRVHDLLHITANLEAMNELVNVQELVAEVLSGLTVRLESQQIETLIDVSQAPRVRADRDLLRRALSNLALNAIEAMPAGGRLYVSSHEGAHGFELEVADSGRGLCDEARRRAFSPFFSTKTGGTGLGLAIVDRIAEKHGGTCLAQNCPDGGAAFTLRIPTRKLRAAA
jgi:signal transduction histidine kinase